MDHKHIPGTSLTKCVSTEWDRTVTLKSFLAGTQETASVLRSASDHFWEASDACPVSGSPYTGCWSWRSPAQGLRPLQWGLCWMSEPAAKAPLEKLQWNLQTEPSERRDSGSWQATRPGTKQKLGDWRRARSQELWTAKANRNRCHHGGGPVSGNDLHCCPWGNWHETLLQGSWAGFQSPRPFLCTLLLAGVILIRSCFLYLTSA